MSSSCSSASRRRFGGGDDRLRTLYRVVDGVQHGGDSALLGKGREDDEMRMDERSLLRRTAG